MTPEEASKAGKRVIIETKHGGDRVAAHYFDTPDGFVYADLGWNEPLNTNHALHYMKCEKFNGGYKNHQGCALDIYIDDEPVSERGDRQTCWQKIFDEFEL